MNGQELSQIRHTLGKTQNELATLLCISPKTIQSYEEGWRSVSVHAERQVLFLMALKTVRDNKISPCWEIRQCSTEFRNNCVAWELKAGHFCWLLTGTTCDGECHHDWDEKMAICRQCEVFRSLAPI